MAIVTLILSLLLTLAWLFYSLLYQSMVVWVLAPAAVLGLFAFVWLSRQSLSNNRLLIYAAIVSLLVSLPWIFKGNLVFTLAVFVIGFIALAGAALSIRRLRKPVNP